MRASWMPLATRQPSTAAASSQAAIVPRNGWAGAAFRAMMPAGTDQSRTQATVRHGTNQRASGRACAASATAKGSSSREYSQVRLLLENAEKAARPQTATEAEAPAVGRPWTTATTA